MQLELGYLLGLVGKTISEPRQVARILFDENISRKTLWTMLVLVVVLNSALGIFASILFPIDPELGPLFSSPLQLAVIEAIFLVVLAYSIYAIGAVFSGQGSLNNAIMTVVWLESVFLLLQSVTIVMTFIAPIFAVLIMLVSVVLFFWILTHFSSENHGFHATGLVFVSIIFFMILAVFALSFILLMLGVQPISVSPQ